MTEDEFQDELDDLVAECASQVTEHVNNCARALGINYRVWYVTSIYGEVQALRYRSDKPRLWGPHPARLAPGRILVQPD